MDEKKIIEDGPYCMSQAAELNHYEKKRLMRNATVEFPFSGDTPRGGAGGLHDLVMGGYVPRRPQI